MTSQKIYYTFLFGMAHNIYKILGVAPSDQEPQLQKFPEGRDLFGGGGRKTFVPGEVCMTSRTIFWLSWVDFQFEVKSSQPILQSYQSKSAGRIKVGRRSWQLSCCLS